MTTVDPTSISAQDKASLTSGSSTWQTTELPGVLPAITLSDGPHGLRRQSPDGDNLGIGTSLPAVCFPPAVGLGSTWNVDLITRVGEQLGIEASALDVQVLLGPGLNIKRSPLCGRNFEYLSEDPYLSGALAAAMVHGVQSQGVAATPKHFAVNNQETDRMRVSAQVSERALREIYLSAFEHVVTTAKPWAIMSSYNRINGQYASLSHRLLTEILRDEWGFDGLVMSDWGAVTDRVAAVAAGLDLEMPPTGTDAQVAEAVTSGDLDEATLDLVVQRLAQLIERTAGPAKQRDVETAQSTALDAAREAITLLSNDGTLPLGPAQQRIAVIGEFARTPRFQGGGSSRVVPTRTVNALEALGELSDAQIDFAPGFTFEAGPGTADADLTLAEEAVNVARGADVVVAFLGLPESAESEGFDRTHLGLPAAQLDLLASLTALDAPVVVVLSSGSVVELPWHDDVAAVMQGWLLGQEGGRALAEVLLGLVNPSGRLNETIPLRLQDHPSYPTFPGSDGVVTYGEDIFVGYRGFDLRGTDVAFPFGHGLSYTRFDYSDLSVTGGEAGTWEVSVTVANTGDRGGAEVVQLYLGGPDESAARAVRELRGFSKVSLQAGESRTVRFELSPRDLSRWNTRAERWQVDAGDYRVQVGASSRDIRLQQVFTSEGDGIIDPLTEDSTVAEWAAHPVASAAIARLREHAPASVQNAPEMAAMIAQMPVMKLTTFGLGFTAQDVRDVIAAANAPARGEEL